MRTPRGHVCGQFLSGQYFLVELLVIRDSQVLAKLGVVTIFFIGWVGGGGRVITKSVPGVYYLKLTLATELFLYVLFC